MYYNISALIRLGFRLQEVATVSVVVTVISILREASINVSCYIISSHGILLPYK